MKKIKGMFKAYIEAQLQEKKNYFETPVWNKNFLRLSPTNSLEGSLSQTRNSMMICPQKMIEVPIKFRFGLFAMKYLRDKFKAKSQLAP